MALAICIYCGDHKKGPFATCTRCGKSPTGSDIEMARSLYLSSDVFLDNSDTKLDEEDLKALSQKIACSEPVCYPEEIINVLLKQKRQLENSNKIQWGFLLFGFSFLILPVVAILLLIFG